MNKLSLKSIATIITSFTSLTGHELDMQEGKGYLKVQPKHHGLDQASPKLYIPLAKNGVGVVHLSAFKLTGPGFMEPTTKNGRVLAWIDFSQPVEVIEAALLKALKTIAESPKAEKAEPKARKEKKVSAPIELDEEAIKERMMAALG